MTCCSSSITVQIFACEPTIVWGRSDSSRELPHSQTSSESSYSFKCHGAPYFDGFDTDTDNDGQSDFENEPFQPSNFSAHLTQFIETLRGGALLTQVGWLPDKERLWSMFLAVCSGLVAEGRCGSFKLGPPCSPFFMTHLFPTTPVTLYGAP